MDPTLLLAIVVVILALLFAFSNGFNDAANAIATVISTGALTPAQAIIGAAVCEFAGAYFLGTAVAMTISKGIIDPELIAGGGGIIIVMAALIGSTLWNVWCTVLGFPISASHSLIGGFIGSAFFGYGAMCIQWDNVIKIFMVLLLTPVLGIIASFLLLKVTYFFLQNATPRVKKIIRIMNVASAMLFALAHGTNDGQKPMGIIVFSLIVLGFYKTPADNFVIPVWVVIACAAAITLGVAVGGRGVIKTVGSGIFRIRDIHAFSAQLSGAAVIYVATIFGLPLSTTHMISSTVTGAGAGERVKGVRWQMMGKIFIVWIITIPATAAFCGVIYMLLKNMAGFLGI
ncbi:MAG: inorganic phosphate transporter [Elusimicrobia bacterium]|nr:inorganic phosphate transporter [Elusimicrobiota bacterium]